MAVVVLSSFLLVAIAEIAGAQDLTLIDRGVDRFFKVLSAEGLDGVERAVQLGYKAYDFKPSLAALQAVVGMDLAGYLFYAHLEERIKAGMSTYDLWDQDDAVIRRVDRRLAKHISVESKRQEVMLLWLRSVKTRMHLHYLQERK
jgi:hypothetical protein